MITLAGEIILASFLSFAKRTSFTKQRENGPHCMAQVTIISQCQMELTRNLCTHCIFPSKLVGSSDGTCGFIATTWAKIWFLIQHYSEIYYKDLLSAMSHLQCTKAMKCFPTHWKNEPSIIDVPRSNIELREL